MNDRLYFFLGDIISNAAVGVMAALASYSLFQGTLPMPIGMLLGMVLGMFIALITGTLIFIRYFGAMEVMLPTMLTGMVAGMIPTMYMLDFQSTLAAGVLSGLCVVVLCNWANSMLATGKEDT
jgi:hypothetical protein